MAKQRESAGDNEELIALREEVASLRDHVRLLVDAIDEVREELQWLTRNGLPCHEPLPPTPVLKQMAADPCADDWGERLVIERGGPPSVAEPVTEPNAPDPPPVPGKPLAGKLFSQPGEQPRLF